MKTLGSFLINDAIFNFIFSAMKKRGKKRKETVLTVVAITGITYFPANVRRGNI